MNRAVAVYYLRNIADAFNSGLIFTSIYAYYVRDMGLSPLQLLLMGTVLMLTGLIFEVPTGVVADAYSRRLSVIIGGALIGLCFVLTGLIPLFAIALLAAFIEAIGDTFVSGALEAWITDEVGAQAVGPVLIRNVQLGSPAHWAGIGVSVLLATLYGHAAPVVVGGALWLVLTAVLIAVMPETGFAPKRPGERLPLPQHLRAALETFGAGTRLLRATPLLLMLALTQLLQGVFFEPFFRLYQAHVLTNLTLPVLTMPGIGALDDVIWFGAIDAAVTLLYLPASEVLRRRVRIDRSAEVSRTLVASYAAALAGALLFAWAGSFWLAVAAFLVLKVALLLTEPLIAAWRNQHIRSDVRATVLSINSQVDMLGQLGGGLAIGALGNRYGVRAALTAAALCLAPLVALIARWRATTDSQDQRG
jgi:MFS transporter, DHA3 family, tetracycline resistance protein